MSCEHNCYKVGGPWISENPNCPIHGSAAQSEAKQQLSDKEEILSSIEKANSIEDIKLILIDILEMI